MTAGQRVAGLFDQTRVFNGERHAFGNCLQDGLVVRTEPFHRARLYAQSADRFAAHTDVRLDIRAFGTSVASVATGAPAGVAVGLALGSQSSSGCVAISGAQATVQAGATSITSGLSGTANAGSYCFIVFDVGNVTGPVTYSVDVSHF